MIHYLSCFDINKYANKPIKQMILDHKVIAGAGNIYACEALYRTGIRPDKIANSLSHQQKRCYFIMFEKFLKRVLNTVEQVFLIIAMLTVKPRNAIAFKCL